jgi:DNA-binding protein HU-beta
LRKSSPGTPEIARGSWKSVVIGFTVSCSRSKKDHWYSEVLHEQSGAHRRTHGEIGLGSSASNCAARVARNPRTGETVKVKPTSVPAFRPGAQFKAVVSGAQRLPAEGPAVKRGVTAGGTARKAVKKAAAKKAVRRGAAKKAVKRGAAKKAVKRGAAKKAVKRGAAKKAVKRSAAKKAVAKKAPAKKAAAKKTANKAPASKAPARKAPAKKGRR